MLALTPASDPTPLDLRLARAAGVTALAALAALFGALTCTEATLINRAGDLACALLVGLICGLGFFVAQGASDGPMGPKGAATVGGLGVALLGSAAVFQGAYCAMLWETGSLGEALQGTLLGGGGIQLGMLALAGLCLGLPAAFACYLRFWPAPLARKGWFAGVLTLLCSAWLSLAIADQRDPYLEDLSGLGRGLRLFPHLGLALGALLPLVAVGAEWRWGPRRQPPPSQRGAGRSRLARLGPSVAGVLLPLLAFLLSEGMGGPRKPTWAAPQLRLWRDLALTPPVQRHLYPLLTWSMVAFALYRFSGRRGPLVRVGLEGGVLLTLLFALAYLHLYPLAAFMVLGYGFGLLGLSPLFALVSYSNAWLDARRDQPPADGLVRGLRALWLAALGVSLWRASEVAVQLQVKLPKEAPPNCYVATAAARAAPARTGAERVRFPSGEVAWISPQLRRLKVGEGLLAARWPRLHAGVRRVYDWLGPPLARRMGPRGARLALAALALPERALVAGCRALAIDLERLAAEVYPPPLRPPQGEP